MKVQYFFIVFFLCSALTSYAQEAGLLIDDFEGPISGGLDGTVDFGAGAGSSVEVGAATDIINCGKQAIKVVYDAVAGGYMWVARGSDLDAQNAGWLVNFQDIEWGKFNAISFYMYGSDSKTKIAFDIKDGGSEMWRFMLEDNFQGWKRITCPFSEFFARGDWQPDSADKNAVLDFPVKSFQFECLPEAKGSLYFDTVELVSTQS